MPKGMYMNPKYAVRRVRLRRAVLVSTVLTLLIVGVGAVWQVDYSIRGNMLPSAPPVAAVVRQQSMQYRISLFGQQFYLDFGGISAGMGQLSQLLRTPPAPVRLAYQLRAYLADELPKNLRDDPRKAQEG